MFRLALVLLSFCVFLHSVNALSPRFKDRIINGEDAAIVDFPYQCSLQKLENHACGCSIYNNKVLITAAHCLVGATQSDINHMQIRCGSNFWSAGGVLRKIDSILIHPSYDTETMANDVALIKLSSQLAFSSTIKPIELATSYPPSESPVVISGWGYRKQDARAMASKLQKATVKYISGKSCSSTLYKYYGDIKDGMICGVGGETDACQGDSGGPMKNSLNNELLGIVSWGEGCAKDGYPGIYCDVLYYALWISKNANAM